MDETIIDFQTMSWSRRNTVELASGVNSKFAHNFGLNKQAKFFYPRVSQHKQSEFSCIVYLFDDVAEIPDSSNDIVGVI